MKLNLCMYVYLCYINISSFGCHQHLFVLLTSRGEDELLGSVCIGASGLMEMTGASTIQSLFLNLHFLCRMPLHSKMQAIHLNRGFYMLHLLSLRFPFCHRVLHLLVNLLYVLYLFLFCYQVCILPAAEFHLLSFPPSQPNLRLLTVPLSRTLALQNTFISWGASSQIVVYFPRYQLQEEWGV